MINLQTGFRRTMFVIVMAAWFALVTVAAGLADTTLGSPQSYADFQVKAGEKVATLWSRLQDNGIGSTQALLQVASSVTFPQYPFVPAPRRDINRFEGLFVPGTYHVLLSYHQFTSPAEAIYQENLRLVKVLLGAYAARLKKDGLSSGDSLRSDLILASIVQKEDVPGEHYGLVASVFLNRLKVGMHLDSCPTLEYSLAYHRPFLLYTDIEIHTPYNTYLNAGLPPTPICFFTNKALESVVHPVSSPYYFFVLDWVKNKIIFARNYAAQQRNADIAREDYVRAHGAGSLFKKEVGVFY